MGDRPVDVAQMDDEAGSGQRHRDRGPDQPGAHDEHRAADVRRRGVVSHGGQPNERAWGRRRRGQPGSCSHSGSTSSQAPSDVLEMTVHVADDAGSCAVQNDTPASWPTSIAISEVACSHRPRP